MLFQSLVVVSLLLPGGVSRRSFSKTSRLAPRGSRRCGEPPEKDPNSEYSQEFAGTVEVAVYECVDDFQRYGERFSYCRRGNWSHPAPHCYRSGCSDLEMTNLLYEKVPNSLYTNVRCFPGYSPSNRTFTIACQGTTWRGSPPRCRKQALLINLPHTCNFENNQCRWKPDIFSPLYWRLNKGKTPTPGTGPQRDHSRPRPGYYMYMETTNIGETAYADLYSPLLEGNMSAWLGGEKRCFAFWYHMHGAGIGNLSVLLRFDKDTLDEAYTLHTIHGPQGDQWLNFQARLPDTKRDYQLIIRGDPGGQDEGDIALDDIFIGASCLLSSEPAPELKLPAEAYGDKPLKERRPATTTGRPTSIHDENATLTTIPTRAEVTTSTLAPTTTDEPSTTMKTSTTTPATRTTSTTGHPSGGFRATTVPEHSREGSSTLTSEPQTSTAAVTTDAVMTSVATESPSMSSTTRSYSPSSSQGSDEVKENSNEGRNNDVPTLPRATSAPRRQPIVPERAPMPDTKSPRKPLVEQSQPQDITIWLRASIRALPIVPIVVSAGVVCVLIGLAMVLYLVRRNQGNSFRVLQAESQMSLPMDWIGPQQSSAGMVEPVLDYHYDREEVDTRYECRSKLLPLTASI